MRQAGEYKHRVTIETPTETRSTGGSQEFSWATFANRWGRIKRATGMEKLMAQQASSERTVEWEIKGRLAVTTKMRLVFDGRYFNIMDVEGEGGKSAINADIILLTCREGPVRAGV